jgi:hypothetical protein
MIDSSQLRKAKPRNAHKAAFTEPVLSVAMRTVLSLCREWTL